MGAPSAEETRDDAPVSSPELIVLITRSLERVLCTLMALTAKSYSCRLSNRGLLYLF